MRHEEFFSEDLRKWFKEKWVRFGPDGKIRGACARGDDSEGKPKCLPQSKAHALGKKGRASAAARKRREDPNPERSGAAINVATKKKATEAYQYDESNVLYRYDADRGRLVQAMIPNRSEQSARQQGYRDTPDQALRIHGIMRSKFDSKKFVQRQAGEWVQVFPFGKHDVEEGRFDEPLTGWHIVYRKSGNPVHATPSFETKDQAQKYLMTKMFANHQDYKVVHTAGVGVAEATGDTKFDAMMGNIKKSAPVPVSGYVAVEYASENKSDRIKGVTLKGKPMPSSVDVDDLDGEIEFSPDEIERHLIKIGRDNGWSVIDPGHGRGYSELFFDTNANYTSDTQSILAKNIVNTVTQINKFFSGLNSSLQSTGLPGYKVSVWQEISSPNGQKIGDINQIKQIALTKVVHSPNDPGELIGQAILRELPAVEQDEYDDFTPEDFAYARKIAKIYITKGERAGLEAQISNRRMDHVSDLIDELLSLSGAQKYRTLKLDDLDEQGMAEGEGKTQKYEMMMRNGQVKKFVAKDDADAKRIAAGHGAKSVIRLRGGVPAGKVAEQGVAEGSDEAEETVRFVLDSERAYQVIMAKFGDIVSWDDNDYMVVPARIWPKVEQVAFDADGIGAERVDDGGPENPEHYGVAEVSKKPNATTRHLRDYPVSSKEVAKPVSKPAKKKEEKNKDDNAMQLKEIDRRGFLGTLGKAAAAGAAATAGGKALARPSLGKISEEDAYTQIKQLQNQAYKDLASVMWRAWPYILNSKFGNQVDRDYPATPGDIVKLLADPLLSYAEEYRQKVRAIKQAAGVTDPANLNVTSAAPSLHETSDPSGLMHAAKYLNNEFIVTAQTAEGNTKRYRVRAQSERTAREKFAQHHSQAKILDVKQTTQK